MVITTQNTLCITDRGNALVCCVHNFTNVLLVFIHIYKMMHLGKNKIE